MIIKRLPMGLFGSNCYIVGDNAEGIIIDAGVESSLVMDAVQKTGLSIKYIILTHAHIDHICFMPDLRRATGAKVLIHEADSAAVTNSCGNGSEMFGVGIDVEEPADGVVKDGDVISAGGLDFEILHIPGHSPGGIGIKVKDCVFTGDTLFRASIGRTDIILGSQEQLVAAIKEKLMVLDDGVTVYPGHGLSSTIGFERENNYYL